MYRKFLFSSVLSALALGTTLTAQHAQAAPQTVLILNSQSGDYIGGGTLQTYTPADGTFQVVPQSGGGLEVSYTGTNFDHWWYLDFIPATGQAFIDGEYEGAQRFPFNSPTKPGLDVSGDGRGCNTLTGRFLLSELALDTDGTVKRLAIDFEQHCEGGPAALYGSVRFNSAVSIAPRVAIGSGSALKGNAGTSDANAVIALSMPADHLVTAQYGTADGTALQGRDYVATTGSVRFPPGTTSQTITVPILGDRQARGNKTFTTQVTSTTGARPGPGAGSMQIFDPNMRMTAIAMNSQPGDYIGGGTSWLLTDADTSLGASRIGTQGVSVSTGEPSFWNASMVAPNGQTLVPGSYKNAERYPFQSSGKPGLDVGGDGRGCNTLTGQFLVSKADYASDGSVKSFAANFEQHCEGGAPALFGAVRVNSILQQASVTNAIINGASAVFTITLNPASAKTETVNFATQDGTATAAKDYSELSQTVTFQPGETAKTISVPLLSAPGHGKQFYGHISSSGRTQLWVQTGSATF